MTTAVPGSAERLESHVDVLIVGAGPAGLMCANALVQAGISVRIVDKRSESVVPGQADGIQPRTLEILQSYGLGDQLHREGAHVWRIVNYSPGPDGVLRRANRSATVSPDGIWRWNYGIALSQDRVENVFLASMKEKNLAVEYATTPTSIKLSDGEDDLLNPQAYVNTAVLEHLEGQKNSETVHAKFILGADGAHSWVRKALGIGAEGTVTSSIWGVVDILPDTDFPDVRNYAIVQSAHHGTLFTIPRERDLIRIYVQQSEDSDVIDPITGRADKNRSSPEQILAQARKIMHPYRMDVKDNGVEWWTIYVVGQRVVDKYSINDRALISGDACHTHSPKAGQGMNAALCDSHNLAWKMAYALKGWAKMSLMQTYDFERRKYAQELIEFDKSWSKLFIVKPRSAENPEGLAVEEFVSIVKQSNRFMTGVGVHYLPSIITNPQYQSFAAGLVVGERVSPHLFLCAADGQPFEIQDLLPADIRFKVLVFGGDITIPADLDRLQEVALALNSPGNFLSRFGRDGEVFDVLCFSSAKQNNTDYFDFPSFFQSHWSKAFLDDADISGKFGGGGYAQYGIDPHAGAIVIVRPDGYVGMIAPLTTHGVSEVTAYFSEFLM
ncbi:FAD binding domain-containing protein [Trametes punicea]|nr:FAD binding domain-containing protein [Trametes punicea]